jgi:hypothetical protein
MESWPSYTYPRRSFTITAAMVSFHGEEHTHTLAQLEVPLTMWLSSRVRRSEKILLGTLTPTHLISVTDNACTAMPAITYSGDVPRDYADVPDEEILTLLEDIAEFIANTLEQDRIRVTYLDRAWNMRAAGPHWRDSASHTPITQR